MTSLLKFFSVLFVALGSLFSSAPAKAQNYTTITATSIADASGPNGLLVSGQVQFVPTDGNGTVIGFRLPGGGQGLTSPVVCNVVSGAITGICKLANTSLTDPLNVCYQVTIVDNNTGLPLRPSDPCYQPVGATDDFDLFIPANPNLPVQTLAGGVSTLPATGVSGGWDVPGLLHAANINGVLNANTFPGGDLGAQIQAADNQLGGNMGTIVVTLPGTLSTAVTLHSWRTLIFNAPVAWGSAALNLGSYTDVHCSSPAAALTLTSAGNFFDVTSKSHVTVHDCSLNNTTQNGFAVANGSTSVGTSFIDVNHVTMLGGGLLATSGTTNTEISVEDSSSTNSQFFASVILFNTIGATVSNVSFTNDLHGVEWWGGDSNGGYTSPAADTLTGNIVLSKNRCKGVSGACLWGSMGFNVAMNGNVAQGCGDTCFDPEGSIRVSVVGNVADCTGGNFCYSSFFGSLDNHFASNIGTRSDSGAIALLKYSAGNSGPRHRNTVFEDNVFTCALAGTQCTAFYSEGDADLVFKNNTITNGTFSENGFHSNSTVTGNTVHYDFVPAGPITAFQFSSPQGESWLRFEGNTVELSIKGTVNPQFAAGSTCASASYSDYNNSDFFSFKRNTCKGFQFAVSTTNMGLNTGPTAQPYMWTFIDENVIDHGTFAHSAPLVNGYVEDHYLVGDHNQLWDGSYAPNNSRQLATAASTATAATVGATSTVAITWPMAFNDVSYTATCSVLATSGSPQVLNLSAQTATGVTVTIQATTAAAAAGSVSCVAIHN